MGGEGDGDGEKGGESGYSLKLVLPFLLEPSCWWPPIIRCPKTPMGEVCSSDAESWEPLRGWCAMGVLVQLCGREIGPDPNLRIPLAGDEVG